MKSPNRRSFLKLSTSITAGTLLSSLAPTLHSQKSPGVIILVLDALSARNMSLYGYARKTTKNFERLAARSNVYHAHRSAGTFTTVGTTSLLTGTYPWTHRAINPKGLITRNRVRHNIFSAVGPQYFRTAFTQNYYADYILSQINNDLDHHFPIGWNSVLDLYISDSAEKDKATKFRTFDELLFTDYFGSLLFGGINSYAKQMLIENLDKSDAKFYGNRLFYNLNDVFSGIGDWTIKETGQPVFSYFHVFPPHDPYLPGEKFKKMYVNDGFLPVEKKPHLLHMFNGATQQQLNDNRLLYDQYVTEADSSLGILLDQLEQSGTLNNNYLVVTSDHGESFERGYLGHFGPYVYETCVMVPLLISSPNQNQRRDFYSTTNSIDVVPTLLKLIDRSIPNWCEGEILPGFSDSQPNQDRITFSMDAKGSNASGELTSITVAMFRGKYKLIYYRYPYRKFKTGVFELYDLESDPEELTDISRRNKIVARELQEIFIGIFDQATRPSQSWN